MYSIQQSTAYISQHSTPQYTLEEYSTVYILKIPSFEVSSSMTHWLYHLDMVLEVEDVLVQDAVAALQVALLLQQLLRSGPVNLSFILAGQLIKI